MANYTFNIAKGRVAEFYNRVEGNDPSTSALIVIPLSAQGTETEAQDYDTVSQVLGGTANEQTAGGWVRKTLTDTELASVTPNDTDNRYDVAVPSVVWTTPAAPNNVVALLIAYDANTGAGDDTNLIPLTTHTFNVTANGQNVTLNAGNFAQST